MIVGCAYNSLFIIGRHIKRKLHFLEDLVLPKTDAKVRHRRNPRETADLSSVQELLSEVCWTSSSNRHMSE
ncbi:hypothetical protein C5167_024275 [Papaver somniferum]|uniref:Uncharacterized protein n=1 Tax=Papaver somniferum TaxID=3469 RepID=A0A4Y7JS17_PAPSO|nr:hypothetical protein C5167_024275 [Papaver somniferum]